MIWPILGAAALLYLWSRKDDADADDAPPAPTRTYSTLGPDNGPEPPMPLPTDTGKTGGAMGLLSTEQLLLDARGGRWGLSINKTYEPELEQTTYPWRARSLDYKPEKVFEGRTAGESSSVNAARTAADFYADRVAEQAVFDKFKDASGTVNAKKA